MKKHFKRALSLILSFVLVLTGMIITPVDTKAASSEFISNQIVLEDDGNVDLSNVLYWKGQEFELSVDVKAGSQSNVIWTTNNSDSETGIMVLDGSNDTVVDSGVGYKIKNKFKIGAKASGSYTITATVNKDGVTESKNFKINVEESLVRDIASVGYQVSGERWTGDVINLYLVTATDVECYGFETDNELVQIVENELLETPYFGKGSNVYKVNAVFGSTIEDEKNQEDSVTITAKTSEGDKSIYYTIKQSASQIKKDSITVSCNDCQYHADCTHINEGQNTIYLDKEQEATISFVVEGSKKDKVVAYIPNGSKYYTYVETKYDDYDEVTKTMPVHVTIKADSVTTKNTPTKITLASPLSNMISKELNIIIYKGEIEDSFSCYSGSTEYPCGSSIVVDEGATDTFESSVTKSDNKEVVTWQSSEPAVVEIDETTGKYVAKKVGNAVLTATVQNTNSGARKQKSVLYMKVSEIIAPDEIIIMQDDGVTPAGDTKLYVGDAATVFTKKATKDGDVGLVYYKDYEWISEGKGTYFTIDSTAGINGPEEKVSITPKAKGSAELRVKTETAVYSKPIKLEVIAPATSISIQKDETPVTSLKVIENRKYTLNAVRNKEASTEYEQIQWSSSNPAIINFIDPETNKECDTYVGETCILNAKTIGTTDVAQITAKTTGLDARSKAVTTCDVTLEESIPVSTVKFKVSGMNNDLTNTKDEPYVFNLPQTTAVNIGIKGYDMQGNISNDEFICTYDSTGIVNVTWDADNEIFAVKPLKAGSATISFKDLQTGEVYTFYIKVQVPATSISFKNANGVYNVLTINKTIEYNLGQDVVLTPTDTTDKIIWSTSDPSVVSVDENGKIKALDYTNDPVIITAQSTLVPDLKAECQIAVVNPITDIEFSAKNQDGEVMALDGNTVLYLNQSMTVEGKIVPAEATDTYGWSSSNPAVASIEVKEDGSCVIVGKAQGKVTISATPKVQLGAQAAVKSFNLTVAKEAVDFEVRSGNVNGAILTDAGIDVLGTTTLYAVLTPSDSQDVVRWSAEPSDALELTVANNGTSHTCAVKKVAEGKKVKLTVMTSNGTEKEFEIRTGKPISECLVEDIATMTYSGKSVRPTIVVKDGDYVLKENTDFTVTYPSDLISVGTKEVVIKGKGAYCESKTISYSVVAANLANATITKIVNQNYTGKEVTPNITVTVGKQLAKGIDYEVVYTNNINAGTATATVKGIGNYTGTNSATFTIVGKTINNPTIENNLYEYTGAAITPAVTVTDGAITLTNGVDYTVAYTDNVELGRATVTVTGMGNYTGSRSTNFTIKAKTLTLDMVKLSKTDYTYNGKNCKPKVTVKEKESGKKLKENTDYVITYPTDLSSKGVKKITVIGKGNYSGTVSVEYGVAEKITLKKPTIKKVSNSKKNTVVFEVKNVTNAEGYEVYYSTSKKFTEDKTEVIDITKNKTNIKKLKKGKTYYFKVRAYKKNSIGRTIYSSMSSVKKVKIKK